MTTLHKTYPAQTSAPPPWWWGIIALAIGSSIGIALGLKLAAWLG